MLSTMSAGRVSAVAVNSGLATEVTAARSAWANGTAVVHIEDARVFTRPSHWLAASLPRPSCDGPVGSDELSATRYPRRSEEHTSELQSLMRISYAVFCLKKQKI